MLSRAKRITGRQSATTFAWPTDASAASSGNGAVGDYHPPIAPTTLDGGRVTVIPEAPRVSAADVERDAFASGYAQGERAGFEAGAHRAEAMLRRLAATIDELVSLRRNMLAHAEREMVLLALAIAKRIVHREVSIDHDLVVTIARVALERLGGKTTATIRLHPDDYAAVTAAHGEAWAGMRVQVAPDDRVSRGGCQVESDVGFIDASIGAQFDRIADEMLGDAEGATDDVHEFVISRV